MSPSFVAITGGPGSGKTALVEYLDSLGYATVPEAAIQIIGELNRERGVAGQMAWRKRNPAGFQRRVLLRMVALEEAAAAAREHAVFCDRGRPDTLAYAWLAGLELAPDLRAMVKAQRYVQVFLLDTLSRFPDRPDTGRTSNRQRSLHIHALLDEAYRSLGYAPVGVPELPIKERARLILSELGSPLPGTRVG